MPTSHMRFITLENDKAALLYLGNGGLRFHMNIDNWVRTAVRGYALTTGQWYHVAGTYDGSIMRLFLNGVQQTSTTISGSVATGSWVELSHTANDEALDGRLDDVRVYNRALSSGEISDLAQGKHPQSSIATTTLGAALDVNGSLTLNSGTLDASTSNYAINIARNFIRNGGVFNARNGIVTFDGSGTQNLDTDAITFNNVTVNSSATLLTRSDYTVNGTLINNGTVRQIKNAVGSGTTFHGSGGYGGVGLSGAELGSTQVNIRGNQDCTTTPGATVRRCFDIAPTNTSGPATVTVTFYFSAGELSGNDCNALNAYHWNGSSWGSPMTLDTSWGGDGRMCESAPYSVRVTGVTNFSPFALKSGSAPGSGPTAVTLTSFCAFVPRYDLWQWLRRFFGR
jgi:hypothetical protein